MSTVAVTTYGPGGYDPDAPDGNVVEEQEIEVPETAQEIADRELQEAIEAATSIAELKDALLGNTSGGRVEGRPS